MIQYHIYPGGKRRIVTFSYDDGPASDERLIDIFNKHGVKGSFHINASRYKNASESEIAHARAVYSGHEVSCHTVSHGWPARMPLQTVVSETLGDRLELERVFGYPVVGMSYPSGSYSREVIEALRCCGIVYSRTTKNTGGFSLPENFLEWHPSCHHRDALSLSERFLATLDSEWTHPLFYIWGHSHEFRTEADWEHIEKVVSTLSGNDKIWYATNLEIYDYMTAQKQLRISVDERTFVNPTALDLWVEKDKRYVIMIPKCSTVRI